MYWVLTATIFFYVCYRLTQKNFLQRPLQLIDEDEVNLQYAVAITYGLQLLRNLVLEANKEALVKASVPMHKLTGLLLHTCVDVRMEAVSLVNLLLSEADFDHLESWLRHEDLRKILDNLCEIARSEPPETEEFVQCLSNLALIVLKSSSEASEKFTKTILKKTRGFFTHEKINLHAKEWTRRQVYYRFVSQVLKGLNKGQTTASIEAFVNTMKKNVLKDRKQAELEALTSEVQEWCEKWMRNWTENRRPLIGFHICKATKLDSDMLCQLVRNIREVVKKPFAWNCSELLY